VSEKNNGDESPLRPVESADQSDSIPEGADWMDALGVTGRPNAGAPERAQIPTPDESDVATPGGDWMGQLDGSAAEPAPASAGGDPTWTGPVQSPQQGRRRERTLATALTAGLVVLVAGAGLLVLAQMSGDESEPDDLAADLAKMEAESGFAALSAAPTAAAAAGDFKCEESESGGTVTGSGAGDTKSVAGVILAFEHAYYSVRDAEKALDLTSDDSPLVDAEALQKGIDSVPKGTEHCVSITPDGSKARVEITEARPSQTPETFVQEITTSRDGDRVAIVAIAEEGQ